MKQTYHSALLPLMIAAPALLAAALIALPSKSDDQPAQAAPTAQDAPAPAIVEQTDA